MVTQQPQTHKIVCLDAFLCPVPSFSIPHTYSEYSNTTLSQVLERVKDATIIITTRVPISSEVILQCPNLVLVAVMGIGYNTIALEACRKQNVAVCNCPASSSEAVAEHAFALYFAAKRRIVDMHVMTMKAEEWPAKSSVFGLYPHLPLVARHDTMGIIGYGALGLSSQIIFPRLKSNNEIRETHRENCKGIVDHSPNRGPQRLVYSSSRSRPISGHSQEFHCSHGRMSVR